MIVQRWIWAPEAAPGVAPDPDDALVGFRHEVTHWEAPDPPETPLALLSVQAACLWSAPLPLEL